MIDRQLLPGSKLLTPVSEKIGVPLDEVNYIAAELAALVFASFFRKTFNASRAPPFVRHFIASITGISLVAFCFGFQQTAITVFISTIVYLIIKVFPSNYSQHVVLVFTMASLSYFHLEAMYYRDPDDYIIDITLVLMIVVQKLTALGYNVHDGRLPEKEIECLPKFRRRYAIRTMPSYLEFFSYIFNFFSVLMGPMCFFTDYKKHMDTDKGETRMRWIVAKKCSLAFSLLIANHILLKYINVANFIYGEESLINSTIFYKFLYTTLGIMILRCKYYFAWYFAEGICNSAGFGYNAETKTWDLCCNVRWLKCEFSSNPQGQMRNWNIQTSNWLRLVVYERAPKSVGTGLTFMMSAIWHGFWPGYYFFFLFGHFMTVAHRKFKYTLSAYVKEKTGKGGNFVWWIVCLICYNVMFNYENV